MVAPDHLPPSRPTSQDLPFADDLLSERSRAWVQQRLQGEVQAGQGVPAEPPAEDGFQAHIAGYTIGGRLGRGGMGTVYACSREGSSERLAIKIISAGKYAAEEDRRRFRSEIGALLRLHHPNLSRLRDFGQDGAVVWFVMDFIDGRPFQGWMQAEKPDPRVIAGLLGHAARAIAHAHRQGIVHRDLNPANLMVLADRTPVIMDFGLARDLSSDEVLTLSGTTVGTPPFMAPEQTLGTKGVVTNRTDIWGMGGILYFALTGRPPFEGASNHEIFTAINESDVARPGSIRPGVPADLEAICLRCLQRVAQDRYEDMDALAADLEAFAAGRRVGVRLPGLYTRLRRRVQHRPLPWALASGLVLLALGFGCYAAVEHIRRWATWTQVENASFEHARPLPPGLIARDGYLGLLPAQPGPGLDGLGAVISASGFSGWWWLERPGLQGSVRVEFEIDSPADDSFEVVVNAAMDRPREWWHHPAGWGIKVQSADVLSLAVVYRDEPGPLLVDNGFLIERAVHHAGSIAVAVEVHDTTCTVTVAGGKPVSITDPLALGGSDHRGIGIRFFSPQTRLRRLRVDRLAMAELVSPLAAPDALLRHGLGREAGAEYRLIAVDHAHSELGNQALLRAYGEACRRRTASDEERFALYDQLLARGRGPQLDEADRMRAVALWSSGHASLALGVARDLVARRPDLNPAQAFLGERAWAVSEDDAGELLRLLARSPPVAGLALAELGLADLSPLTGRRAWIVNITGNHLSDLSPLAGSGATIMYAGRNAISDLKPLSALPGLSRLNLSDNLISDPSLLGGLPVLATLDLMGNRIEHAHGLPASLTDLSLTRNPLVDLSGVPVALLRRLSLAQTLVEDLRPLARALHLEQLDVGETRIATVEPLAELPLTDLRVSGCAVLDHRSLGLPGLRKLIAASIGLADPLVLSRPLAAHLSSLDLRDNQIAVWPDLPAPDLRELALSRCPLRDLGGLPGLAGLRRLELRGCGLGEAAQLAGLKQLDRLDLRDNRLTSLDGLLASPPATFLVQGNPLSDAACAALIEAGQRLKRFDLLVQGTSMLVQRRQDPGLLRSYAVSHGGRRFALLVTPKPCTEAAALQLAAAAGARLAVPGDAGINGLLASGMAGEGDFWLGLQLRGSQVVDDAEVLAPFVALFPPHAYRGYRTLPSDGGRIALLPGGTWGICPNGTAAGVVLEWPEVW